MCKFICSPILEIKILKYVLWVLNNTTDNNKHFFSVKNLQNFRKQSFKNVHLKKKKHKVKTMVDEINIIFPKEYFASSVKKW